MHLDGAVGRLLPNLVVATGTFKNFNTIEDFEASENTDLFNWVFNEVTILS